MEIFLHYILPPLVGALIGYVTNWIAVKMLFRPLRPIYIGKWRLPFTPGIIPRRKEPLAKAIGVAVGSRLFTKEDMLAAFCDKEKREKAVDALADKAEILLQKTINEAGEEIFGASEEEIEKKKQSLCEKISEKVIAALPELHLGETIAEVSGKAVLAKVKSSPLGMFVGEGLVKSFTSSMAEKIDVYVAENGKEMLFPVVRKYADGAAEQPLINVLSGAGLTREGTKKVIGGIYDRVLMPFVAEAAASFDVAKSVEKKVSEMDVKQLEELCLSVMKKELRAITWLGGLIGLILGIINIFL